MYGQSRWFISKQCAAVWSCQHFWFIQTSMHFFLFVLALINEGESQKSPSEPNTGCEEQKRKKFETASSGHEESNSEAERYCQ